jgi:tetratricopeptide (TPR) repeat protein
MELKKIIAFTAFLALLQTSTFAASNNLTDTVTVIPKLVKIGPPPMGPLLDSVTLLKIALEKRFDRKQNEEAAFKNYLEQQRLYASLNDFEIYMPAEQRSLGTLAQVLELNRQNRNLKNQVLINNTYAIYYARKGDLKQSSQYFKESLQVNELLNDKNALAKTTEILAVIAKMNKSYDEAILYHEYNLKVNSGLRKANQIAQAYINLAAIKSLQKKYDDAEFYILRKAFPLFSRMGNKNGRMICFENLAQTYTIQNRLSEAKWYFLQANLMANKLNDISAQVTTLLNIGQIKGKLGETEMALADYKEAELLAKEFNYLSKLIEIKGEVGEIYRKNGNYIAAGDALEEYNKLKSSFLTKGNFKVN